MKLFYNDRYSAAYMSVHHGLRFIDDNGLAAPYIVVQDNTVRDGERFYIDPEQHHLFKPMVGDCVEFEDAFLGKIPFKFNRSMFKPGYVSKPNIIMRDGKHFFMPEMQQ